ncbi:MAG: pyridoxamine 5'-phosphate oxidase family protein [Bacteroidales bacterium]|nr:pyridoxamine 5'-phosphate oxidase family protein [Bacteroidales bacterium]
MRRKDREIKDNKIIEEILLKSDICRLGLIDNNEAYIVPVNYGYKDGIIYIHSAPAGRKIELIRKDNRVSFEVEFTSEIVRNKIPCKWASRYRSVMGKGTVLIVDEINSKKKGLDLILKKYGAAGDLGYDDSALSRMVLLKLIITSVTGKQSGNWQ